MKDVIFVVNLQEKKIEELTEQELVERHYNDPNRDSVYFTSEGDTVTIHYPSNKITIVKADEWETVEDAMYRLKKAKMEENDNIVLFWERAKAEEFLTQFTES